MKEYLIRFEPYDRDSLGGCNPTGFDLEIKSFRCIYCSKLYEPCKGSTSELLEGMGVELEGSSITSSTL